MWMELFVLPSLENFIGVFRNTRMSLRSRLIYRILRLFRFLLFLHVQELVVLVVEFVLQESKFLRGNHLDA